MSKFNFSKIIDQEQKRQDENSSNGNASNNPYPTLYPFNNGKLGLKFIGNEPSGLFYREIHFHERIINNNKFRVPCLHKMYNLPCPVCDAVAQIQGVMGDNNVYRKYGCKTRGLMFAQLISFEPANYFGSNQNPPKIGDVVTFMFPKSVCNELTNLILEFSEELDSLFTNNTTRLISLNIQTGANGFPNYSFYVKNKDVTLFIDQDGNPDNNAFNSFMASMPNLNELKFGTTPSDNDIKSINALVEEINNIYLKQGQQQNKTPQISNVGYNGGVGYTQPVANINKTNINNFTPHVNSISATQSNVNDDDNTNNDEQTSVSDDEKPTNVSKSTKNVEKTETSTSKHEDANGRPSCFGHNKYTEECEDCPWEAQCI